MIRKDRIPASDERVAENILLIYTYNPNLHIWNMTQD